MRCFFCNDITGTGTFVKLPDREERHLFNTIRGRLGDTVQLIDGKGILATAKVAEDKKLCVLDVREFKEPGIKVHLFVSPPKHNKMDQMLTQCCEIGIWRITLVIMEHSVVRPEEGIVSEKWNVHLIEGCKQSRNPFIPILEEVITFPMMLERIAEGKLSAFFGAVEDGTVGNAISTVAGNDIAWIVGPEGGFSENEESLMKDAGFTPFRIGKWILRTETAAVAGAALLMNGGNKC